MCSSQTAADNLAAESVAGRVELVGDVMVDVARRWQPIARDNASAPAAYGLAPGEYLLLTAHRAGNVDEPERLRALVELVRALPAPVLFPLHPRTRARLQDAGLLEQLGGAAGVQLSEPLGYVEFSALLCQARAVLTDSGGVQKEAYLAGVPCLTLRTQHRVGGDGAGRLEHAGRPRRRRRARGARARALDGAPASSTATATRPSAASRRSGRCDPADLGARL